MPLPEALRKAVAEEIASRDTVRLRETAARLSAAYHENRESREGLHQSPVLTSDDLRAAYLAVRLPATYAAVEAALRWTRQCCGESQAELRTALDLGCGPGTALWAALEFFPELQQATAVERDGRMLEVASRMAAHSEHPTLRNARWTEGDLCGALPASEGDSSGKWDLVLCSYALNELSPAQQAALVARAWERTGKLLVVIEPGTRAGFANVLAARTQLVAAGATLAAPCPNALACPMAASGDWCHFAARVERTAEHRRLKQAELSYEDEKFAYVAFARMDAAPAAARIVRHPRIFSGYTHLNLCREGQVAQVTVTRSQKEDWRRLKRLGWGDAW